MMKNRFKKPADEKPADITSSIEMGSISSKSQSKEVAMIKALSILNQTNMELVAQRQQEL